MGSNQGKWQGERYTSQGYQAQKLARHLGPKIYMSAMIQPVPKSKKGAKKHIQASEPSNIITTSHNRVSTVVRSTN
jgi:hypothetical protein